MLKILEYSLYVTIIGMGGVFVVLSILSMFMWSMGRLNAFKKPKVGRSKQNEMDQKESFSEKELFAILSAVYTYESEQNSVFTVTRSEVWKNAARMEGLR